MNSFQRICRSPAFLVLALILCAAVIAGGVALAPAAPKVWIVIPVLLAVAAVICFFVARSTSKAALQKKKEAENEGVVKADLDHAGIAANILAALGGKANVQKASCCATRLRFQLKDGAKVDEKALKSAGASGVIRSTPTACQVILGTQVRFVYEELQKLLSGSVPHPGSGFRSQDFLLYFPKIFLCFFSLFSTISSFFVVFVLYYR